MKTKIHKSDENLLNKIERVEALKALQESEEKYRLLFENMTQGFSLHDIITNDLGQPIDYRYVSVNPAFSKLTGIPADAIVGKRILEVAPNIEPYWIEKFGQVALTGNPITYENYAKEFGKYYETWVFCPKIGQFAVVFSDISKRKKIEEELHLKNEELLSAEEEIRASNEELVASNYALQEYNANLLKAEEEIRASNMELETINRTLNKNMHELEQARKKAEASKNKVRAINIQFKALNNKLRVANIELFEAKEKAEAANKLITAFLRNISHEVRTPLNAIVGFTDLLTNGNIPKEQTIRFSKIIMESSNQLTSVITDIINISTIESGQIQLFKRKTNINDLLSKMYSKYLPNITGKEIELVFNPIQESSIVIIDENKVTQILSNLLNNAIKFTEKGRIEYGCSFLNYHLQFFVKDTGIGIEKYFHEKIFERFIQAKNTLNREYGGNGLGLSIAQAYVKLLGGKIWLESKPGVGSTFYFTIRYHPISK